jgi:NAD(P)-dependent dehydrogenase (short-subunit alcohol dehydrogenase family)
MTKTLSGKSALVTGGSSGLGLHFAQLLAAQGAAVTLGARRIEALEQACEDIRRAGGVARAIKLDVADGGSIAASFAGAPPYDIVVNNAGVSGVGRALDLSEEDWDAVFDVNLKGAFLVARHAATAMRDGGRGGSIVNIASVAGLRVSGELSAYSASKAGLIHLTKALALEWARFGIRVNALCPGYIETDMNREFFATTAGEAMVKRIPQRRLGRPEDLDGPLLLLATDAGRYMTGAVVAVDGGHLISAL